MTMRCLKCHKEARAHRYGYCPECYKIANASHETPKCECQAFKAAQLGGTDNEGYGRLVRWFGDGWQIGCDLPTINYCPWCGLELADKTP